MNIKINNAGTVDYWQASIASAYDYSPFGVMLTGRTFEGKQTICEDSTTLITQKPLEEGFSSWGSWTTMGNGLVTYVSGEMQVSNPNTSKKDIGASKAFTTGTGLHNVSFEVIGNTCATVVIWPPSSTPIPINVSVKDNYGNVVASGNYTTAGTYNLSFTPASASATYTLEFYMTKASAFCFFRVDDVLVSFDDTTTVTVCKEVEDGYRYGFGSHEKIDEISGSGNTVDMGDRWLDVRLGRTHKMDAKARSYPAINPYAYVVNSPIIAIDPDGKDVIVLNEEAKQNILNSLDPNDRKHVKFDKDGRLDVTKLSKSKSQSGNYQALLTLAKSEIIYKFIVAESYPDKTEEGGERALVGDDVKTGVKGVTLFPNADKDPSPDNDVWIYTSNKLSEKSQAENTAHEGYGHAYFYELLQQGEDVNPYHTYDTKETEGDFIEFEGQMIQSVGTIAVPSNLKLENQIRERVKEAGENFNKSK